MSKEDIDEQIKKSMATVEGQLCAGMAEVAKKACTGALTNLQQINETRFSNLEEGQKRIEQRMAQLETGQTKLQATLDKALARSGSVPDFGSDAVRAPPSQSPGAPPSSGLASGFWRRLDLTKLFVSTHGNAIVPMAAFKSLVAKLAGEANLSPTDYNIEGKPLDSKFTIQFIGGVATAKTASSQFLLSLRLGPGAFKNTEVADADGNPTKTYFNADKNGAQVRKEIQARRLWEVIKAADTTREYFLKRENGTIYVDKRPLAQIQVLSEEQSRIAWMHSKRAAVGLEEADIERDFLSRVAESSEQWS